MSPSVSSPPPRLISDELWALVEPQRGALTGPNPTDRGKVGSTYHLLVDAHGVR